MYKLFEKVVHDNILNEINVKKPEFPNMQQQGYRKQMGSNTVAFNLHESIFNTLELGDKAFIAFLDIRKAFDTVWHKGLLHKLKLLGIGSQYLDLISNAYRNITSVVSVNTYQSSPFNIQRGIRQGGVLSSLFYLVFINDLVEELDKSNLGVSVCDIKAGNPTLVDDLTLITRSPLLLQRMINICADYAMNWKFQFSADKCSVMTASLNPRLSTVNYIWTVNNEALKQSRSSTHVGIPITSNMKCHEKVQNACRKGRAALHRLIGLDATAQFPKLNPITLTKLYKSVVIPSALYGCETWYQMTASDFNELEKFQHYCVKKIQCLPMKTRSYMSESLIGLSNISFEIDKRKLFFLERLIRLPENSASKQIFIRRLFAYLNNITDRAPLGFMPDIVTLLARYDLSSYLEKYIADYSFPATAIWKRTVKFALFQHQVKSFQLAMESDTDFIRFKKIHDFIKPSILWQAASTPAEVKLMHFTIKCLVLIPREVTEVCRNCGIVFTDPLSHITTSCIATLNVRTTFWDYIVDTLSPSCSVFLSGLHNEEFLHILLGKQLPTIVEEFHDRKAYFSFVKICANYVYTAINIYYGA